MLNRFAMALMATASTLTPLAAAAQEAVDNEEIVVTATKREELLREVPQSITAITAETLERTQTNDLEEIAQRAPGLTVEGGRPGNERLTIRGLNTGGIASTVGVYVDETPFGSSSALANGAVLALDLDPADIQRVEVLRGPQGTLYGASALGGVIRYVTVDPSTDDFSVRLRGTVESTEDGEESYAARALMNIPLGGQAGLRLSAWQRNEGGYIDDPARGVDDVNDQQITGARANFVLHATNALTFRLSAMTQSIENDADSVVDYFAVPLEPVAGELDQQRNFSEYGDVNYNIFNGTVEWDLGWASLTSSSSYSELDQFRRDDSTVALGAASYLDNDMTQNKFTQEVRLTSPSSDTFEWQLGLYYDDEDAFLDQAVYLGTPPGPFYIGLGLGSDYTERAVFGNATVHFGPTFDVNVGARYAENEQDVEQFSGGALLAAQSSEDDVTTYSIAPRWRVSDETMIYGRFATGYRPGGPNVLSPFSTTIPTSFNADTATNYELGVKTDLFGGMLRFDAAVFHIDWDDIQLVISDGTVSGNGNGGTAESEGVEWSLALRPTQAFTINWTGAYTDAHLTSDTDPSGGPLLVGGFDGDTLPGVPDWSSTLDAEYEFTAFGGNLAYVGGTYRYVGERMTGFSTTLIALEGVNQLELPSYDVFDLRAGVELDQFTVELFAKNVTDERDPISFGGLAATPPNNGPLYNGAAQVLRPRTVGVSLTTTF